MSSRNRWIVRAILCAAVLVGVLAFVSNSSAGCTGTMYVYYQTSAKITETGAKLVCPSGVYYDTGPNGTFQQTPYFDTYTGMSCPCSGGGNGGGETGEDGEPGPDPE